MIEVIDFRVVRPRKHRSARVVAGAALGLSELMAASSRIPDALYSNLSADPLGRTPCPRIGRASTLCTSCDPTVAALCECSVMAMAGIGPRAWRMQLLGPTPSSLHWQRTHGRAWKSAGRIPLWAQGGIDKSSFNASAARQCCRRQLCGPEAKYASTI